MKKTILFNSTATEKRAALLEEGKLTELVVERPDQFRILGNIYIGKVTKLLPGIQSAFVDVGLDKAAFLHGSDVDPSLIMDDADDLIENYTERNSRSKRRKVVRVPIEKVLKIGQSLLVQVTKEAIGNKSPKVTTKISLAGRFLVLVPDTDFVGVSKRSSDNKDRRNLKKIVERAKPKGIGFIVRTIGLDVSEDEMINEMEALVKDWKKVQDKALAASGIGLVHKEFGITTQVIRDLFSAEVDKVIVDQLDDFREIISYLNSAAPQHASRVEQYKGEQGLFDHYNIEKDVERSLRRKVWLKKGGYLFFDHAEALLAIDVNTGRNVGKNDLEETIFQTNMESAVEICRQMRIRDIGGLIVVDFIDMRNLDNRKKIEAVMSELLERDPSATSMTKLSKFGLMEITRKRVRPELQELFTDVCHACNGLGRVFSPATVTSKIDHWLNRANKNEIGGNIDLFVSTSVDSYISDLKGDLISDLGKGSGFNINYSVNEELDQDEFEIYKAGKLEQITDKYR